MNAIEKILHENESILVAAEVSKTFYTGILLLYGDIVDATSYAKQGTRKGA